MHLHLQHDINEYPVKDRLHLKSALLVYTLRPVRIVLGAQVISVSASEDLNNCTKMGVNYIWNTSPINAPRNNCNMYNSFFRGTNTFGQVCIYTSTSDPQIFVRYQDGQDNWSDWHKVSYDVPSFYKNYNSLVELKAALAAI